MKAINQIILEGEIVALPKKNEFTVEYIRNYPKDSKILFATENYRVVMPEMMAKNIGRFIEKGRGVRIVGNLGKRNKGVIINAEHIEFKPNFKKTTD